MYKAKIDLPVLLIFFTRPDTLEKVFEKVKEARPSKLFLACDGPREGNANDVLKIEECKKIVEDIDWECEVYKRFSDVNLGCGKGPAAAISWAFEHVDRIVVLEDDCVPNATFFPYMQELLDKYKDDERVGMISGLNHFKEWDCGGNSYCFAKTGAIWGWGTWRRVWKDYDYNIKDIEDAHLVKMIENSIVDKTAKVNRIRRFKLAKAKIDSGENISFWDMQFGFLKDKNSYLAVVPNHNLIFNIGVGEGSTHAIAVETSKWKRGKLHFIPIQDVEIPLKHPNYVIRDYQYDLLVDKTWGFPHPIVKFYRRAVRGIKRIFKKV